MFDYPETHVTSIRQSMGFHTVPRDQHILTLRMDFAAIPRDKFVRGIWVGGLFLMQSNFLVKFVRLMIINFILTACFCV